MKGDPFDRFFSSIFDGDTPFFTNRGGVGGVSSSSCHVQQVDDQVQVEVDVPGVAAQDISVQVINTPQCVVQWSGERQRRRPPVDKEDTETSSSFSTSRFAHRIQLGPSVDCDQLAANLSRGVLTLTVPLKQPQQQHLEPGGRLIPITQKE